MTEKQSSVLSIVLLAIACLLFFTAGSASVPLLGSDEPRYAEVAKEMMQGHDYIVPYLGHMAWFEKPIALYWLIALSFKLFGVNEFAARLPSACAALGTIALV